MILNADNLLVNADNADASMRYEALARAVFNCEKKGDPFKIAAKEHFSTSITVPTLPVKRAVSTVLIKMIIDNPDNAYTSKLIQLEDKVWSVKSQDDIVDIIDDAIIVLKEQILR